MSEWALACPRGHRSITLHRDRFRCGGCYYHGLDDDYDKSELVDLRREDPPLANDGGGSS